jgi:hypothetical protein
VGSLVVIREHVDRLRAELAELAPTALSGADAAAVVAVGVEIERLGAATCTRYARRVAETKAYDGYESAANWLAAKTGESTGAAQGLLDVAEKLAEAPLVDEAFSDGRLPQADDSGTAAGGATGARRRLRRPGLPEYEVPRDRPRLGALPGRSDAARQSAIALHPPSPVENGVRVPAARAVGRTTVGAAA